ncbi:hypothetical protein D1AOALGA4SA_936 [Olavius algarvensis Delta 1 endosymbiont]|nr:hypothetical protein D1AOALGA4SA_936 [Olavius algarvensis Delta 1 endosymbiont]
MTLIDKSAGIRENRNSTWHDLSKTIAGSPMSRQLMEVVI